MTALPHALVPIAASPERDRSRRNQGGAVETDMLVATTHEMKSDSRSQPQ